MYELIRNNNKGFTILEILISITIVAFLFGIVVFAGSGYRSKARDSKTLADKQQIILALVRAKEIDSRNRYPGMGTVSQWVCLKESGNCGSGSYSASANSSINNLLLPFITVFPRPRGTLTGQVRHDAYLYHPNLSGEAYIIWSQEKPISSCSGNNLGQIETGIYYCREKLPI